MTVRDGRPQDDELPVGSDADEVLKVLSEKGIGRTLAKQAAARKPAAKGKKFEALFNMEFYRVILGEILCGGSNGSRL